METSFYPGGPVHFSWQDIPRQLAVPLLKGSVGRLHLVSMANLALELTHSVDTQQALHLLDIASGLLTAAWEADPLDPVVAGQLLSVQNVRPFLPQASLKLAKLFAAMPPAPENLKELHACLAARDTPVTLRYLDARRREEPHNLFWLRQGIMVALVEGRHDWLERWITRDDSLPRPIRDALLGDVYFARSGYREAAEFYRKALRYLPVPTWRERLGESCYRMGLRDEALTQWDAVLVLRPWHTNLLLRRDDVRRERDNAGELPEGRGMVLLYTWNKAEYLDMTLRSLAASNLGDTNILVLDNGCTDATPGVLDTWEDRLASRVRRVTLPCNIGAPAARNWLLSLPETRACDWVAFLDDDAMVPPDWLRLFGRAMREYPDHPVYGCRVVSHHDAMTVQSADLHLDPGGPSGAADGIESGGEPAHIRRFFVSGIHHQVLDFGQFSYMRPCVSVTGCCHLFRRRALDAVGPFDLRFSPSQYDDLEHDVRFVLAGHLPLYQGHLQVRHMRCSGRATWTDAVQLMASWANLFKLQTRYTAEEYETVRAVEHKALLEDMLGRCDA